MPLILHASTDRHKEWGGLKRYVRIVVYDTTAELRVAAVRYRPNTNFSHAAATFSPAPDRERCNEEGEWILIVPPHWTGVLRFSREWLTTEVVTHECVHAAATIYRMDVVPTIILGPGCGYREETLAYIIGDLTAAVSDALCRGEVFEERRYP